MSGEYTDGGEHFAIYRFIESLCCIPETSNIVCQLYSINFF